MQETLVNSMAGAEKRQLVTVYKISPGSILDGGLSPWDSLVNVKYVF